MAKENFIPIGLDEGIQLGELAMGEVNEKFPDALKEAVANILSFDYPGAAKREIIIKVTLTPNDDRSSAEVEVGVSTKLAVRRPAKTKLYFHSKTGADLTVTETNPQQPNLQFK